MNYIHKEGRAILLTILLVFAAIAFFVQQSGGSWFWLPVFIGAVLLLLVGSGQAEPNRPNVNTAERAITFFIRLYSPVFFKECYFYFIV